MLTFDKRMRAAAKLFLILYCLFGAGVGWADWKTPREALDQRIVSDYFGIYYTLNGENAYPSYLDAGQRAVSAASYATTLATQFQQADAYYRNILGMVHPLEGLRYATAAARSVDIQIMALDGLSGSTGDEIHDFNYVNFGPSPAAAAIALTNALEPGDLTPNHELFHVYQNSYSFFKNPWYTEGMARASESFFGERFRAVALPSSTAALANILTQSYEASSLWYRLIQLCGGGILKYSLENFGRQDRAAATVRGIDPLAWPEDEQWSEVNNAYLIQGLAQAVQAHCPTTSNAELAQFLVVLKQSAPGQPAILAPAMLDFPGFVATIAMRGGATTRRSDGSVEVQVGGEIHLGWPGAAAQACSVVGLYFDAVGLAHHGNGQKCQVLYPAAADYARLAAIVAGLDPSSGFNVEFDASATLTLVGRRFSLRPAYILAPDDGAHAGEDYWIEGDGRLHVRFPALGKVQAFELSEF